MTDRSKNRVFPLIEQHVIHDLDTGRQIEASAMTQFRLAGWMGWQHPDYTTSSPLTILPDVDQRITFPSRELVAFPQFVREPQIRGVKYPLWDFDNNVVRSYPENRFSRYKLRIQCTARAVSAASGTGLTAKVRIPNSITIVGDTKSLIKGTQPTRTLWELSFYADQVSETTGFEIYIEGVGVSVEIYNLNFLMTSY